MLLLSLLAVLLIWVGVGYALYWYRGRVPESGSKPLIRRASHPMCLVGDQVDITLACSSIGLPRDKSDSRPEPWDIVLLLDHSGSMGSGVGSPLEEAKQAAINLVRTTPSSFRFAVLEFDHDARLICPLSHRGRGLMRGLNGIEGGGGTDISRALERTHDAAQQQDPAAERAKAVILLSDGGSEPSAAIASAATLKAQEWKIITVGIGAANMGLLREIASTPDDCYAAEDAAQLSELYHWIGRTMAAQRLTAVKVSERINIPKGWGLRGWGEIAPVERNVREGHLAWLLATVEGTPIELSYRLEALCPGWHPIAQAPATMEFELVRDDGERQQQKRVRSNRTPRILVLPRIPAWQFLFLILNPLFFIIFKGRFCRKERLRPLPEVVATPAKGFALPPLLQREKGLPELPLSPSLIIGLGYGGIHALLHAKRLLWERGERAALEQVHFLAIDSASEESFPNPTLSEVSLRRGERLHLNAPLEPTIAQAAEELGRDDWAWLEAHRLLAGGVRPDLHRGSGHRRALGRLAIKQNRERLRERCGEQLDAIATLSGSAGESGEVVVTVSAGGGTGSGGVLELCWLLRILAVERGQPINITLLLLAPSGSDGEEARRWELPMRRANARALLLELDRIVTQRERPLAPEAGAEPIKQWVDEIIAVGPWDDSHWPAHTALYPKAGESIVSWLSSPHLREHFIHSARQRAGRSQELGRCLLQRWDPYSYYLFPRTLLRALAVEMLQRWLPGRLWQHHPAAAQGDSDAAGELSELRGYWHKQKNWSSDFPWVIQYREQLRDQNRLHDLFLGGGGPQISNGVFLLERTRLFKDQRLMLRNLLDAWIDETLNGLPDNQFQPHSLGAVVHLLSELSDDLAEGKRQARHLSSQASASVVQDESAVAAELIAHAHTEVTHCLEQLDAWSQALDQGAGRGRRGLRAHLAYLGGQLDEQLEQLRKQHSPRLPFTAQALDQLRERHLDPVFNSLLERFGWETERSDSDYRLRIALQGADGASRWQLQEEPSAEIHNDLTLLAEQLIAIAIDLAEGVERWTVDDIVGTESEPLRPLPPRTERLNQGARGVLLQRGERLIEAPSHTAIESLTPDDPQETQAISCEQDLLSDHLWPARWEERAYPFVFTEEHQAYRAYAAYCRSEHLQMENLHPSVCAFGAHLINLADFVQRGLIEGKLVLRTEQGRAVWIAALEEGDIRLGSDLSDDIALLDVAHEWCQKIRHEQLALDRLPAPQVLARLSEHSASPEIVELLTASRELADQLGEMLAGFSLLRGF